MEQRLAVGGKRVTTGRLSSVVVDLFREAFPGPEPVGKTESVSRPRYAAVKDDVGIPDFAYSSEIAFQHTERILVGEAEFLWKGLHQTVRMVLQLVTAALYPEGYRTKRNSRELAMARASLASISALLYLVLRPGMTRSQTLLALIPHRGRIGFLVPRRRQSPLWRRAVSTFLDRQRQALRGGGAYDRERLNATVYVEDSGEVGYTGFTHEWRDRQWDRAGPLIRTTEHGEHRARPHRDQGGGMGNKYVTWRRTAAGTHT